MGRQVAKVLMDLNANISSDRVYIAPKIAPDESEEDFEIKECTEEDSLSENVPKVETPKDVVARKLSITLNGNAKVSKNDARVVAVRKPLQQQNKKHIDEDDDKMGKSGVTHGSAPRFKSTQRAEKRKEYYQKLEEKNNALEAERNNLEQRQKEEQEAALKQFRKNLNFKAKPVPNFYYEAPLAKPELKKLPLTRPKSPKLILSRRKSFSDAISSSSCEEILKTVSTRNRHSTGTVHIKDDLKKKNKAGLKPVNESSEEA